MGLTLVENTLRVGYLSLLLSFTAMMLLTMRSSFRQSRVPTRRRRSTRKNQENS